MNKLTAHHFLYLILALCLLACGVWIARQQIAQARAEERSKAHEDSIKQIEQARKDKDAELEAARNKPATVQTVTRYLPSPLPAKSEIKLETLPDSPLPQVVLTGDAQANLNAIQTMEIEHLKCDNNLSACQSELKQMTADRNNWRDATKGGSKLHKFVKILEVTGCAAGAGAIGSIAGKTRGAAIGGAVGAAGCSILW